MTKLKKTRIGLYSSLGVLVLVALVAIGFGVDAFNGNLNPTTVIENANIENFNEAPEGEASFGAMASPDISSPYLSVNGDTVWHIRGTFLDASTTLCSIDMSDYGLGITGSTTVVEMARLRIDGAATSTFTVACGASADGYAAPTYSILSSGEVATGTVDEIIENDIATTYNGNSTGVGGGSVPKIVLTTSYPYLVCTVTTGYSSNAFLNTANTFDGQYLFRVSQMR